MLHFHCSIDEKLLKDSLKINLLYPYQQPCCITYNQLKQSITTAVSIRGIYIIAYVITQ